MLELAASAFVRAHFPVELGDDEVQLWWFERPEDVRAATAALLAAYLQCTPGDVHFERNQHGKPFLPGPAVLQFNLSHSSGALLVAVSRKQALGVDIERLGRQRPVLELARRYFDAEEAAALARI